MEIQISREVFAKVMHWVNKSNDEVSGFGKVIHHAETGVFEVVEAYLLKQRNGAVHTDIDGQSLAKLMYTSKDAPGELKWWWHSHVNMQVFWSGTDTATIRELGGQGWIIATVFNKREEHRSALCYQATTPFGNSVELRDEIPTFILDDFSEKTSEWDKEYDDNVEKRTYSQYHCGGYSEHDWRANAYGGQPSLLEDTRKAKGMVDDGSPNVGSPADAIALEKEKAEYWSTGYYGFGAKEEAKIVGMSPSRYVQTLVWGTREEVNRIDDMLEAAVKDGRLV